MTNSSWYEAPLSFEDLFAGLFLIIFATFFLLLYALVAYVMYSIDKDVVGFRFLFSASIADMLLLVNYGFWPGLTILCKSELITTAMRHWVQMYLDWAWFSMCYHYMIISWSRCAAIRRPLQFRTQSRHFSYTICGACYIWSFIQVMCTHFQPWYVTFFYDPKEYGMAAEDFEKYLHGGQSLMFFSFHLLMIVIPIFFYTYAIYLLVHHRHNSLSKSGHGGHSHIESRLIFPCIFNTAVFVLGQIVITVGTGQGRWGSWMVMLLFSANSAVNPVLLLCFSELIRRKLLEMLGFRSHLADNKYMTVPIYRHSVSPSPPARDQSMTEDSQYMSISIRSMQAGTAL